MSVAPITWRRQYPRAVFAICGEAAFVAMKSDGPSLAPLGLLVALYTVSSICDRLQERVAQIEQGPPAANFYAGPVINQIAHKRVLDYIEIGKQEGRLLIGGHAVETAEKGFYIAPTVIADVAPTARIAQEEIFGPVLAVIKSTSFDEALAIANNTEYGLTGAIYSTSREKLDRAREEFHAGNLYLNRKCTGAMVGAHPFGGFNMSGTDSKAGGPDYLLLFTQAKSIAEKITPITLPLGE